MVYFINNDFKEALIMDIRVGDVLVMKKNHPCGNNEFTVVRSGMDFKLECKKCGHLVMTPRLKAEKNIKKVIRDGEVL
mgnify:CR=1 FL=1